MTNHDIWADALSEAEAPHRRDAGLWAKCFAEAGGDEARAKAAYVQARVGAPQAPAAGIVTTQKTSKRYKAGEAIGVILVTIGVVSCAASNGRNVDLIVFFFGLGLAIMLWARIGAWCLRGSCL